MHFKKNIIRVVHSWHFWPIFQPFSISFFFPFFSNLKLRMKEIWIQNGTLMLLLQKWTWKMIIFLAVCLMGKMHFCSIFLIFPFQGIHSNHFSFFLPFFLLFCLFLCQIHKNKLKMSLKMGWKWPNNGYHEQPYWKCLLLCSHTGNRVSDVFWGVVGLLKFLCHACVIDDCYDSFTYFSPLIFLVYSLHAPTSCLLFLVYILISFYRLSFSFMHSLTVYV